VFGQQRSTLDEAFPGDIVGLVNAGALRPGDTLYAERPVEFPPIPSFAPEHFAVVRGADAGKFKQFRKGIAQLDSEGVIQVLRSDRRGDQAPVLAAVGPLQFEVVSARMADEFGSPVLLDAAALPGRARHRRRRRPRARPRERHRGAHPHQRRRAARGVRQQVAAGDDPPQAPGVTMEPLLAGTVEH
jgi:peptide subunit release factor RF-3